MASRARKYTTPRTWTQETAYTKRIAARIPLELNSRLKGLVDSSKLTVTDVVIVALQEYFEKRGL